MNSRYREIGQTFRLGRAVVSLGNFTVSELISVTDVNPNTVYSFLCDLGDQYLKSEELPSEGRGRPRKRYWLTAAGLEMLGKRNAETLREMQTQRPAAREELLREIMKLPADERLALVEQVTQSTAEQKQAVQYESA